MLRYNEFHNNENLDPLYNHNLSIAKGYTPDYESNTIYGKIHDEHLPSFNAALKFHIRGLRYKDEIENFLDKYRLEIINCDPYNGYIYFKTEGNPEQTILLLQDSVYFDWLDLFDKRENEKDILQNIGQSIIEFSDEYSENSDDDIKLFIEKSIIELTELKNSLK